jgi:hypothetical protein
MSAAAVEIAREFWRLMSTNDFHAVGAVLADDFILDLSNRWAVLVPSQQFSGANQGDT